MPGIKSPGSFFSRNFGRRKYIHVAMNRQFSLGKNKNNAAPASGKQWVHPAEALLRGHIVYNVKFLGHVEVDNPKGTQVVKDAIRKMKFNKQIKKAEGQKPPKVELTISVDGVTVQEPKFKVIQHQYPLHRISYCADDKSDKRMFTFIAKDGESNVHRCFVLDSEKCAEEITLTIGQAFDLAYKRFLETSGKDMDAKKQSLLMQKKVHQLTQENLHLKARVADLERLIDPQTLEEFDRQRQNGKMPEHGADTLPTSDIYATPMRSHKKQPILTGTSDGDSGAVVGRKLENLVFDDDFAASTHVTLQTNGSSSPPRQEPIPALAPPPPVPPRHGDRQVQPGQQSLVNTTTTTPQQQQEQGLDLFGATPFTPPQGAPPAGKASAPDPFGMGSFDPSPQELDRQIAKVDKELLDLQIWEDSWPWNYMQTEDSPS